MLTLIEEVNTTHGEEHTKYQWRRRCHLVVCVDLLFAFVVTIALLVFLEAGCIGGFSKKESKIQEIKTFFRSFTLPYLQHKLDDKWFFSWLILAWDTLPLHVLIFVASLLVITQTFRTRAKSDIAFCSIKFWLVVSFLLLVSNLTSLFYRRWDIVITQLVFRVGFMGVAWMHCKELMAERNIINQMEKNKQKISFGDILISVKSEKSTVLDKLDT